METPKIFILTMIYQYLICSDNADDCKIYEQWSQGGIIMLEWMNENVTCEFLGDQRYARDSNVK